MYELAPLFMVPLLCIGAPFALGQLIRESDFVGKEFYSDMFLCSTIVSVIAIIAFNEVLLDPASILGVRTFY